MIRMSIPAIPGLSFEVETVQEAYELWKILIVLFKEYLK